MANDSAPPASAAANFFLFPGAHVPHASPMPPPLAPPPSLVNPGSDRVPHKQYSVDIGQGGRLRCAFSRTHDLLFVLLQREVRGRGERGGGRGLALLHASRPHPPLQRHSRSNTLSQIIVFDLELGQPAASTQLPPSRSPFDELLGCYGHASAGKSGLRGGLDVLLCSHRDGSLSVWQRAPRALAYTCLGLTRLIPHALKFQAGSTPTLPCLAAGLWGGLQQAGCSSAGIASEGAEPSGCTALVMGVASDGRVWQWQVAIPASTAPEGKGGAAPLPAPKPELLGGCGGMRGAACLDPCARCMAPLNCVPASPSPPYPPRPAAHAAPASHRHQRLPSARGPPCRRRRGGDGGGGHCRWHTGAGNYASGCAGATARHGDRCARA